MSSLIDSIRVLKSFLLLAGVLTLSCEKNLESKGADCLRLGDFENAIQFFKRAVEKRPTSPRARRGLGIAFMQQADALEREKKTSSDSWRRAVRQLDMAGRLNSPEAWEADLTEASFRLSRSLASEGDTTAALNAILKSAKLSPRDATILNYAGILSYNYGNEEDAYNFFLQATVVDSLDATACLNIGIIHWHREEISDAHRWWFKALMLSPEDENIIYWYSKADLELERLGR